jgi:hypothetical protein
MPALGFKRKWMVKSQLFETHVFSSLKKKWSEQLTGDRMWKSQVVLDTHKDLQDPVLGWIIMQNLMSRIILLSPSTQNCCIVFGHIIIGVIRSVLPSVLQPASQQQPATAGYHKWNDVFFNAPISYRGTRRTTGAWQTVLDIFLV